MSKTKSELSSKIEDILLNELYIEDEPYSQEVYPSKQINYQSRQDAVEKIVDYVTGDFQEDHAVVFVAWLAMNHPDALHEHGNDDDGGEEAFKALYNQFKESLE